VLKHYEIISAIVQFFNQRDEPITELENSIWRRDFGFLVDITEKLIELNLQLRGRYKELAEMISDIKAFVNKPEFWEQNLIDGDTRHFPVLSAKISQSPLEPYDKKTSLYPNVIMRGTKLILMEVGNVKFLDSLNYFPMPLTALPKAFDLKELKKGYFPHLFNTLAHQNYVGPIPALDFYDPDHLKEDAREKLLKWHGERQAEGYVFDFQKEIVEYCISDVEILTQACLKFRDLMKTETTVDPFQESTTIASCCNKVFRRNFLKPETIGILPNQNLYHPVLPSKMNNKLMFVNCQKCGEDFVREECQHSIQERSLKGTWVIEEVLKAIEKGYQIIETYEIWEYDTIQLSKDQEGLFSGMMNKFLQIKQQASGWPKHCLTDEEKNRYIDAFLDREDIKLEFSKIIENPCLRSLAKLMLNSFWGKFAQKENQNKTSIVRDCGEFFDMLTNPSIHVNTVLPVNEETLLITWEFREEAYDVSSTVNVVLASYVTALARLKLYSFLEKVEERAVYVDTDSCIYISRKGLDDISTGDFIGDMTDELNGGFISEFVSGGPKNYAYKYTTLSGEEQIVCKHKTSTIFRQGRQLHHNMTKSLASCGAVKFKESLVKSSYSFSTISFKLRQCISFFSLRFHFIWLREIDGGFLFNHTSARTSSTPTSKTDARVPMAKHSQNGLRVQKGLS
ncbi:unnamed protein product, partial [Acanthoscelides obtectus]